MKILSIVDSLEEKDSLETLVKGMKGTDVETVLIEEIKGDFGFFAYDIICIWDRYTKGEVEELLDFVKMGNSVYRSLKSVHFIVLTRDALVNKLFISKAERITKLGVFHFTSLKGFRGILTEVVKSEGGQKRRTPVGAEKSFERKKVLFVDDSATMHGVAKEAFSDERFLLFTAKDGREGLNIFLNEKPDIVITDVFMPHIDGYELCRIIRSNRTTKDVPVLIISEVSNLEAIDKGYEAGAQGFLFKSMTPEAIRTKVLNCFSEEENSTEFLVLLSDGATDEAKRLEKELATKGLKAVRCGNGMDALYLTLRLKPDVLVTELVLPFLDGFEFVNKIRGFERIKGTKVVFLTGRGAPNDEELAEELGAVRLFKKPLEFEQLYLLLKQLLVNKINFYHAEYNLVLSSIQSLAAALDARDEYTRGHSERVKNYSIRIAEAMGMYQDDIDILARAADLHDIGKIGIKDHVLLKEGPLTDDEYEMIKQHPSIAHKILSPLSSLSEVSKIILHHHERWDGRGYPQGLKERAIPLSARIVAVADTYDAITSNRPYRDSKSNEKALAIIEAVKGSQLCPLCVATFLRIMESERKFGVDKTLRT